jgi:hypothetical protein
VGQAGGLWGVCVCVCVCVCVLLVGSSACGGGASERSVAPCITCGHGADVLLSDLPCVSCTLRIRYLGIENIYKTKSFGWQYSDTRLYAPPGARPARAKGGGRGRSLEAARLFTEAGEGGVLFSMYNAIL